MIKLTPELLDIGLYTTDKRGDYVLVTNGIDHEHTSCYVVSFHKSKHSLSYYGIKHYTIEELTEWMQTVNDEWFVDSDYVVGNPNKHSSALIKLGQACDALSDEMIESAGLCDIVSQQGWFNKSLDEIAVEARALAFHDTVLPGDVITLANHDWQILDKNDDTTLVMRSTPLTYFSGCENYNNTHSTWNGITNNWATSKTRHLLNHDLLTILIDCGLEEDAIVPTTVDLTSLDGFIDYGATEDKLFLLTLDMYRKYRWFINIDKPWFLCTPYSTDPLLSQYLMSVSEKGSILKTDCLSHTCTVNIYPAMRLRTSYVENY